MKPAPANIWQVPRLCAILRAAPRGMPWLPRTRPVWTDLILLVRVCLRGWVRVLRDEQGLAGFIIRDGARVHALYVHPRAQGCGIGRALLAEAKEKAGQLDLWVVQDNRRARRFYCGEGFAEKARSTGAGNDEKLPDILMVWPPERRAEI